MTRMILDPIAVQLEDLPPEGQEYRYDQGHPEMKNCLVDLLGDNEFNIQLHIQPGVGVFLMTGTLKTRLNLACYRCAVDFQFPIDEKINEILVLEEERPRASHSARVNHSSELDSEAPAMTSISSPHFHLGQFVHELVALAEPMQPKAKENCGEDCENLQEAFANGWLVKTGEVSEAPLNLQANPFARLKDWKINR